MHQVASRDLPVRQREVRGEDISSYYETFPPQPPMSVEVELDLVRRMKAGDPAAEDRLTRQYAGIGISMALAFKKSRRYEGSDLDDLVSAALLGVVEGLHHYEEGRGSRVSTCVYFWVRAQLLRCKKTQRFISYPKSKGEFVVRMQQEARLFFNTTGKAPTREELAHALGTTVGEMEEISREHADTTTYCVDSTSVRDPDSASMGWTDDFVVRGQDATPDLAAGAEEIEVMEASIESDLDSREAVVIRGRFLQDKTLDVLGEELHLSRERVRQIETEALKKLRRALKEKLGI